MRWSIPQRFSEKGRKARRAERERERLERKRRVLAERWETLKREQPELAEAATAILANFLDGERSPRSWQNLEDVLPRPEHPLSTQAQQWLQDNELIRERAVWGYTRVTPGPHAYPVGPKEIIGHVLCVTTEAREVIRRQFGPGFWTEEYA